MNIVDLQEYGRRELGDHDRLIYRGRTWRFEEIYQGSLTIAAALLERDVQFGDRVGVVLPSSPEFHIAFPAIWRIGAVLVPIHYSHPVPEIANILRLTQCKVVITRAELAPRLAAELGELPDHQFLVTGDDGGRFGDFDRLWTTWPREVPAIRSCGPKDPAVIVFTSGTSGAPKGTVQSHANFLWLAQAYRDTPWMVPPRCTTVSYASPAHTGPGPYQTALAYIQARTTVLLDDFDAEAVLQAIETHKVDLYSGTPTTFIALCRFPAFADYDLSSVRTWCASAAPFAPAQEAFCENKLGRRILHVYGLSECVGAPVHERALPGDPAMPRGASGRPLRGVTIKIADDDGDELAIGEVGEVCIRCPANALGYFNAPEESQRTFRGEWVHSGDLGRVDREGFLYIVGRKTEQINQGGFKVMPQEISRVIDAIPEVEACVVAGLPDELFGQVVGAFIQLRPGRTLEPSAIIEHCRTRLASQKVPRRIVFVDSFPLNANYKIDTRRLVRDHGRPLAPAPQSLATRDALISEVRRVVARLLALDPRDVASDASLMELGVTSLQTVALADELGRLVGRPLATTLIFDHPTVAAIADHLLGSAASAEPRRARASRRDVYEPIAVVGMSARFPGAEDGLASLWQVLDRGVDATADIQRWDFATLHDPTPFTPGKSITRRAAMLSSIDRFDAALFGMSPHQARYTDPSHRLALELCWEALEHAGLAPLGLKGSATGLYLGFTNTAGNFQLRQRYATPAEAIDNTGSSPAMLAGRISYFYGFRGPAVVVDTTCSSSLVAFHQACQSLRDGECNIALSGGVCLLVVPDGFVSLSSLNALAPDGRCKTFDARANGYARGEGGGMFVLKRLDDARRDGDAVLAVVRGSALNHDGRSTSLTAPSGTAQQAVMRDALANAGVEASSVGYVEAHGTGTVLGDAIELHSILEVYGAGRTLIAPLVVGSVKTNIGHAEGAAGAAAVAKTVLALQHRKIPASLHFERFNPTINLAGRHLAVPSRTIDWPERGGRRLAGVSSFGLSGTNAHVVLEAAEPAGLTPGSPERVSDRRAHVLVLSARTPAALAGLAAKYVAWLGDSEDDVADICATAALRRSHLEERLAVVGGDRAELAAALSAHLSTHLAGSSTPSVFRGRVELGRDRQKVAWLFPGQGEQYVGMAGELAASCAPFRAAIERSARAFAPYLEHPLLEMIAGAHGAELIHETRYTQPCLFAVEHAIATTWLAWGLAPDVVLGHSLGELVAATIAGAMTLDDAARLVALRAKLMAEVPMAGAMAAVAADANEVDAIVERFGGAVSIAAVNAPRSLVISGRREEVGLACARLRERGVKVKELKVSQAFHSTVLDPMLDELEIAGNAIRFQSPIVSVISNVDARPVAAFSGRYWRDHARRAVRFADGVAAARAAGAQVFVEVGPGSALSALTQINVDAATVVPGIRRDRGAWVQMMEAVGQLFVAGVPVDWRQLAPSARAHAPIPTYAFDRHDFRVPLIDADVGPRAADADAPGPRPIADVLDPRRDPAEIRAWIERAVRSVLHLDEALAIDPSRDLATLGADSLGAIQLRSKLVKALGDAGRALNAKWPAELTVAALTRVVGELVTASASALVADAHEPVAPPALSTVRAHVATAPRIEARYLVQRGTPARPAHVLLHGYMQSADVITRELAPAIPAGDALLAIDGPMATAKPSGELGYFWFPLKAGRTEPEPFAASASAYVESVVPAVADLPAERILIGFSQGGTVATLAAMHLPNVRRVITICSPLEPVRQALEAGGPPPSCEIVTLLREHDDFLDPDQSRADLEALRAGGCRVITHVLPGRAHAIDPACLQLLATYLGGSR